MIAGGVIEWLAERRTSDPLALAWAGLVSAMCNWLPWMLFVSAVLLPGAHWVISALVGSNLLLGCWMLFVHARRVRRAWRQRDGADPPA